VNVLSAFKKHTQAMMAIKNSAIRPNLQGTRLARPKRGSQLFTRDAPEKFELCAIQGAFGV